MKKNKLLITIGAAVLIGIVSLLAYRAQNQGASEDVIRIGAILPLTGKYADTGNSVVAGLDLAINKINANVTRKKISVEYFDTKSEVKNAVLGYNKLKTLSNMRIFFTTLSDNSLALKSAAIQDGNLLFCIASHADITKDNKKLVFRPINTGDDEAHFLSRYIKESGVRKKIYFYIFNTEAGLAVERIFKGELDDKIIGVNLYGDDYSTIRHVTTKATYKDADCIVVVGYSPTMGIIVKYLRESGYTNEIIANLGFNNPATIKAAGGHAKGIWYNDYAFPYDSDEFRLRNEVSMKKFHSEFTALSYISYSCVHILDKLISKVGQEPAVIGEVLSAENTYDVEGLKFVSHKDGSITSAYKMLQIQE